MRKRRYEYSQAPKSAVMFFFKLLSFASVVSCWSDESRPKFDFDKLGNIVLGGDFDALTAITYAGQDTVLALPSTGVDNIIYQSKDDQFIQHAFADGIISQSCLVNEMFIMAGNFTNILNTSTPNGIAGLYFQNNSVVDITETLNLSKTLKGTDINTVWCNDTVALLGGQFELGDTAGVVMYDTASFTWTRPDFGGFVRDSVIESIIPYGENLIFGGSFNGLVPLSSLGPLNEANQTNSSSLFKPGMQPVSLYLAQAAGYGSSNASPQNASSILCPLTSSGWESNIDSTTGFINVTLAYVSEPTWIRLYNLADGSGTKTFRIISEPAGSFMNMTYIDENGTKQSCSAYCPLPEYNSTIRSTDFQFVNVVPTSNLQIQLLDFYGDHAGLQGIELFEAGQFVFAMNDLNQRRACGSASDDNTLTPTSQVDLTGDGWSRVDDFMSTEVTDKSLFTSVYVDFEPFLSSAETNSGFYELLLYTPGCKPYDICSSRGKVNVTVHTGLGTSKSSILYQTNEDLKYDVIYNGTLKKGAYVRVEPTTDNNVPLDFVAYKLSLQYTASSHRNASNIFEFSPSYFSSSGEPVALTAVNSLGEKFGSSNVSVNALLLENNDTLLIGGSGFPSNLSQSNLISLPLNEGPSASITSIDLNDESEIVTKLANLSNSILAFSDKTSYILNNSVVTDLDVGRISNVTALSLHGSRFWAFTPANTDHNVISVFDPSSRTLVAPSSMKPAFIGRLSSMSELDNQTVYTGAVMIVDSITAGNAETISGNSNQNVTLPFSIGNDIIALSKRDTDTGGADANKINTGAFLDSSNLLLAGHFNARDSQNSTVFNALEVFSDNSTLNSSGVDGINSLSQDGTTILATALLNETLAMGGTFSGKINGNDVQSLLIYVAPSNGSVRLSDKQPQPLTKTADSIIKALAFKPNTSELLVGGTFAADDGISNDTCNSLCIYDISQNSWKSLAGSGLQLGTTINSLVFETADRVVLAGDIRTSNNAGQVAIYDFSNGTLSLLPSLSAAASQLVVLSNSTVAPQYAAAGNSSFAPDFVKYFDGSGWKSIPGNPLKSGSIVRDLSVVSLQSSSTADTNSSGTPFGPNKALLISGELKTDAALDISVLLYDGSQWTSLYVAQNIANSETPASIATVFSEYEGDLKGGVSFSAPTKTSRPQQTNSGTPGGPSQKQRGEMPAGHVVGIACAIGICCVLLLTIVYLLFEWILNRGDSNPYQNLSQYKPGDDLMAGTKIVK